MGDMTDDVLAEDERLAFALGNNKGWEYAVASRVESMLDEAVLSGALSAAERKAVHLRVADAVPADVQRAIATIESSRETHVHWAEYRRLGGTDDPGAGDELHHRTCIVDYDHVLTALRRALALAPSERIKP